MADTEREYSLLEGELTTIPNSRTIRIRAGDTIIIRGIGEYLSGRYFVTQVSRAINAGGYSHTFTVMKLGLTSLKDPDAINQTAPTATTPTPSTPPPATPPVVTTLKVGDRVTFCNSNATYSNASEGVRVPASVQSGKYTISQISTDKKRALLKEIYSWTYVKYLKKVN